MTVDEDDVDPEIEKGILDLSTLYLMAFWDLLQM